MWSAKGGPAGEHTPVLFKVVYQHEDGTERDIDANLVEDDGTTRIDRRIM